MPGTVISAPQRASGLRQVMRALPPDPATPAVLAIVVGTDGSTYRKPGALLLRGPGSNAGWLSGGCLEAELDLIATEVLAEGRARVHGINTSGDDDLLFGSASGCRGAITLLLLPVRGDSPIVGALRHLYAGATALTLRLRDDGSGDARSADQTWTWPATGSGGSRDWSMAFASPPRLLLLGAGPEASPLIRHAQELGWWVEAVEHRGRWIGHACDADRVIEMAPDAAWRTGALEGFDAALVMGHHFANDLAHLGHVAETDWGYLGLLGPPARRDALLAELPARTVEGLRPRLHAPVGLHVGGEGPEPIALAIVADLQRHFSGIRE